MSSLQENLAALSASLPEVPAELASLQAQLERVERGVVDFLNELGEKEAEASGRMQELQQALEGLGQESASERSQLEAAVGALEEGLDQGLQALRTEQGTISEALEGVEAAVASVQSALDEAATTSRQAVQEAGQELRELGESARSAREACGTSFEAASAEAEHLRAAVDESRARVQESLDGLAQRLRALDEQGSQRIEQTAERLRELRTAHEAEIPEARARLTEGQHTIANDLRERLEGELKARITEAAASVLQALAEMRAQGGAAVTECVRGREGLEAGFAALREAAAPLPQAIQAVRQAAELVGLPWE